jgi:hypothetical protein
MTLLIAVAAAILTVAMTPLYEQHPSSVELGPDDIAKMASPGNHCLESVSGGGLRVVDGDCFYIDSEGNIQFINQAHEECTGTETWFCSFHGLRRMPTQEEIEKPIYPSRLGQRVIGIGLIVVAEATAIIGIGMLDIGAIVIGLIIIGASAGIGYLGAITLGRAVYFELSFHS